MPIKDVPTLKIKCGIDATMLYITYQKNLDSADERMQNMGSTSSQRMDNAKMHSMRRFAVKRDIPCRDRSVLLLL